MPLAHKKVTLLSGENRSRGAVLGVIAIGAAVSAAKAGGNTGTGALTLDVTTPVRAGAKVGVYRVRCIAAAANSGTFRVEDPDGIVLGDVVVGGTFDDDLKFAIADGGTDFIVDDGFDITVAAGSGKVKLSAAAAVDGSAIPDLILAEACDASAGDKEALVYTRGDFNQNSLTFGAGHTAATVRDILRAKGINLVNVKGA
ncbi:MAG: head decoration protein [Gemmatimonadales bacterium]|nr:head decoration protein [Gemmatimonadales bacterium]